MNEVTKILRAAESGETADNVTKKLTGEGFKRPWPPLIKMDAAVKGKIVRLFGQ